MPLRLKENRPALAEFGSRIGAMTEGAFSIREMYGGSGFGKVVRIDVTGTRWSALEAITMWGLPENRAVCPVSRSLEHVRAGTATVLFAPNPSLALTLVPPEISRYGGAIAKVCVLVQVSEPVGHSWIPQNSWERHGRDHINARSMGRIQAGHCRNLKRSLVEVGRER
jgi:hypothetical protein